MEQKNPDIVTLTADGEVTVVECKIKANFPKDDVDRMAKTYITIQDFAGPLPLHDGNSLINNNLDKWRYIYKSCYKSRFPSLRNSFEELFLLKNYEAIRKWADQSMKHIKSNRFRYIVAYSGEAVSYSIHALCKKFQSTINTYDSSMSNLSENLLFLSISKEGEIHYLKSISDF